ncbi:MAG: DUF882 domain-containing protein, partial [Rhizobiales bacterium]|nr:DUF882 domain-containing protein [Hyphomicrobiales bacterium]
MILTGSAMPAQAANERRLKFYFTHTKETINIVYKRNGRYVPSALRKLNKFLRDWRQNEPTKMDPRLFDLLWSVYQEVGAKKAIHVVSAYRSPKTNKMLRRRSRGVAKNSQHMRGKAMDFFIPGVNLGKLRATGLKMEVGGVGYYPTSGSPFVHLDTGSVRHWPRMTQKQLVKVFPRGDTTHTGTNGRQLKRYKEAKNRQAKLAKVEIAPLNTRRGGRLARLFNRNKPKATIPTTQQTLSRVGSEKATAAAKNVGATPQSKPGNPAANSGPGNAPTDLLADTAMQVAYATAPAPRPIPARLIALRKLDEKQKQLVVLAALKADKDRVLAQNTGRAFSSAWSKVGDGRSTDVASIAAPIEPAAAKEDRADGGANTRQAPNMAKAVLAALNRTRNLSGAEPTDTEANTEQGGSRFTNPSPASAASIAATILARSAPINTGDNAALVSAYAPTAPTPLTRPEFTAALGTRRNALQQPIQRAELAPPATQSAAADITANDTGNETPIVTARLSVPAIQPRQRPAPRALLTRAPLARAALPSRRTLAPAQQANLEPSLTGRIPASALRKSKSGLEFHGGEQAVLASMITPETTRSEEFARFQMPS